MLQRGIDAGLWTLEDLDRPSPRWKLATGIKAWAFGHATSNRLCTQTLSVRRLRMSRISSDAVSALWFPEHSGLNDEHHTRIDGYKGAQLPRVP